MRKTIGWLTASLGLGLLLTACGGTDNGGAAVAEGDIVGKWNVSTIQTKGWETDFDGNKVNTDTIETAPPGTFIEFKSDKTFVYNVGFTFNGTWSLKGNTVTTIMTVLGFTDTTQTTVSISGNSGTFTSHEVDSEQDLVTTLKATKQ